MLRLALSMALLSSLAATSPAQAAPGFRGTIQFTEAEKALHEKGVETIVKEAALCLQADIAHHKEFFAKNGFSPYYGDRSLFGRLAHGKKRAYLAQRKFNPNLLNVMTPTSCIGLTLKCLGAGFAAAGQSHLWKRIKDYTMNNYVDGSSMQEGLQKLGWKLLYWNPSPALNGEWDAAEKKKNPSNKDRFWGYHVENWRTVTRFKKYLYNKVDDSRLLVDFGKNVPELLKKVPFFVGSAHMGYHVFPGFYGEVVESHSMRPITDPKTLQAAPFNPLNGDAPTDGTYFSGVIAVPARYVETVAQ